MDLNLCVNEASAYADMKHSLRTYEVFATQIWCEARVNFPWAKGSLHRATSCFIFHASQTRFIEKTTNFCRSLSFFCVKATKKIFFAFCNKVLNSRVPITPKACMESMQSIVWNPLQDGMESSRRKCTFGDAMRLRRFHSHLRWDYIPSLRLE